MSRWSIRGISPTVRVVLLLLLPVAVFLVSLPLGRYPISLGETLSAIWGRLFGGGSGVSEAVDTIIFNVRLPRIAAAMLVGMALSVSGASYQGMFRNPLVSPDILGASAGAGFGAALGILLSLNALNIQLIAFGFGMLAVFVVYFISTRIKRGDPTLVLVLTGILIGTVFTSLISIIKFVADPYEKLPAITFWLMGSLASINTTDVLISLGPILFGATALYLLRWRLNALSFGEEEARTLGINTGRTRFVVIACATLMTAAAVSMAGMIGWIGLVVPHLARALVGPNYKVLIPAAAIVGSTFLLIVDDVARLVTPLEMPLGIMTSLIGAPLFIYLLASTRKGWL